MRKYGVTVENWGKVINLNLIHKPINSYLNARAELSELESRVIDEVQQLPPPEKYEADWSEAWEEIKQAAKNSGLASKIIPVPVYDWLEKKGILVLDVEEKKGLIEQAKENFRQACLNDNRFKNENRAMYNILRVGNLNAKDSPIEWGRIVNDAKVLAVKQLAMAESI